VSDLLVALGLVLVIEGLLWSLSPGPGRKLLEAAAAHLRCPCASAARRPSLPAC
jgi:uncharacterized protein YjeT (DUF2065 family)